MATFTFICRDCGQPHEGSPSFGYARPDYWNSALDDDQSGASRLSKDLCKIVDRDYFIRCTLEIPIHGVEEGFLWGVWATQSAENFRLYAETFDDTPEHITFGYLANRLPYYPETLGLHLEVHWQAHGRERPKLALRECDHPLYRDWRDGISWDRAVEIATTSIHSI
jgi:hypothetical protein